MFKLKHLQQYFPHLRIGTLEYNADNRRGVVGIADAGLQLKTAPCEGSQGRDHGQKDSFQPFQGAIRSLKTQKLRRLKRWVVEPTALVQIYGMKYLNRGSEMLNRE